MATVNKDFKIKNGLVVEGSTATVNGHDILTDAIVDAKGDILVASGADAVVRLAVGTDNYVLTADANATNGVAWKAPAAVGEFTSSITFEGSTADGNETTIAVTDPTADRTITFPDADGTVALTSDIDALDTDDIEEGSTNLYYSDTLVDSHLSGGDGITYSSGTISADVATGQGIGLELGQLIVDRATVDTWYDTAGDADAAETAANTYTDTALEDYTPTASLDTTVGGYGYLKSADLGDYATQTYVNDAVDALVDGAPGLLDTLNEIAAAINDDENYATTMTTALSGKQNNLTAGDNIALVNDVISVTGLASTDISDFATAAQSAGTGYFDPIGSADTAESDANAYTDGQLENYTTTANLETTIDGYGFAYTSELPTSSDDLSEGVNNLYYSNGRVLDAVDLAIQGGTQTNISVSYNTLTQKFDFVAENGVADSDTDDLTEGSTNLYFSDERAVDAIDAADITPNTVTIDTYRKEEATQQVVSSASTVNVHSLSGTYESVKYLVRVVATVGGTKHSQLTEILMTVDGGNNIAITEYGTIYTSENPLATFSATMSGITPFEVPTLTATTAVAGCEIIAAATMLSWAN